MDRKRGIFRAPYLYAYFIFKYEVVYGVGIGKYLVVAYLPFPFLRPAAQFKSYYAENGFAENSAAHL